MVAEKLNSDMPPGLEERLKTAMFDNRLKHVNLLLMACAACIGFAVTQTKNEVLSAWALPWLISVLMWAFSFFCGCRFISKRADALGDELFMLQWNKPITLPGGQVVTLKTNMDEEDDYGSQLWGSMLRAFDWQFGLFLAGAVFFIVWHILEMWRRTEEYTCVLWY